MVPGHRDIVYRDGVLERAGVDVQIISLTTPGTHIETPALATRLAAVTNDAFAAVVSRYPRRFAAFATLPLCDPAASAAEFVRAMDQLHLSGAMLFSNVNSIGLDDRRFWPLYGGVAHRYPNIRWVLGHLGGTIPYLAERLDRGFHAFKECRAHIDRPPTTYLKTQFYYDTVNFSRDALMCAIAFAGADHVVAGSDDPHQIGSIQKMIEAISSLPIGEADKAAIFGGTMARLIGREAA